MLAPDPAEADEDVAEGEVEPDDVEGLPVTVHEAVLSGVTKLYQSN